MHRAGQGKTDFRARTNAKTKRLGNRKAVSDSQANPRKPDCQGKGTEGLAENGDGHRSKKRQ